MFVEDIQVILIYFCGKLPEGNNLMKRNQPRFDELVALPIGSVTPINKDKYEVKKRPPLFKKRPPIVI